MPETGYIPSSKLEEQLLEEYIDVILSIVKDSVEEEINDKKTSASNRRKHLSNSK